MKIHIAGQVLLLLALAAPAGFAADNDWTVDSEHSHVKISFKSLSLKFRTIPCEFKKITGTAQYDGKDLSHASIKTRIDPSSLTSSQPKLGEKLMGVNFLDVGQYPQLEFTSIKFEPDEHGGFTVQGKLKMHGIEQKVSFEGTPLRTLSFNELGERSRISASAFGKVNRADFAIYGGKLDKSGLKLSNTVEVELTLELTRS